MIRGNWKLVNEKKSVPLQYVCSGIKRKYETVKNNKIDYQ